MTMSLYYNRNEQTGEISEADSILDILDASCGQRIAFDQIGDVDVSTVFLGINHQFGDGPPILFETMIFGGEHDEYQKRYRTELEAIDGHADAVALVKGDAP